MLSIISNILIATSCFLAAGSLMYLVYKRPDLYLSGIYKFFSLFMFLAGISRITDAIDVSDSVAAWFLYSIRFLVALFGVLSAVLLALSVPYVLALPTNKQLEEAIAAKIDAEKRTLSMGQRLKQWDAELTRRISDLTTARVPLGIEGREYWVRNRLENVRDELRKINEEVESEK